MFVTTATRGAQPELGQAEKTYRDDVRQALLTAAGATSVDFLVPAQTHPSPAGAPAVPSVLALPDTPVAAATPVSRSSSDEPHRVTHDGPNDLPLVNVTVTSLGIERAGLTLRLQFREEQIPTKIWAYHDVATDDDRWREPPPDSDLHLRSKVTNCGFLQWQHAGTGTRGLKYGLARKWPTG